jgi:O-antigen/teichoic acid export membrane protein
MKRQRNLVNALLYSTESISSLLFSVVSIALIARHFGPEIYARYSMAQSVSTMFIVFATLGLEPFVLRELARNRNDSQYATSALGGMLFGWLAYLALIAGYYAAFQDLSRDLLVLISVAVSTLFLKVIFVRIDLQAQNKPKPIALGSLASRVLAVLYLLAGAHFQFSFELMMLYLPIQAGTLLAMMLALHPEFFHLIKPRQFSISRLTSGLKEAAPIFASTVLYYFYNQSDILMMSELTNDKTVGIYAAANRLIPQATFIGFVIVSTFYRDMDVKLRENKEAFFDYVKLLLSIQFTAGLIMAAAVALCSPWIIYLLYGQKYEGSAAVLATSCWAWVFVLPAALYSRLLIMLGLGKYELIKMLVVAPIILGLNYLAISQIGMLGAAVVYVFSYFLVDFLIYFVFKETRILGLTGLAAAKDVIFSPRSTASKAVYLLKARQSV